MLARWPYRRNVVVPGMSMARGHDMGIQSTDVTPGRAIIRIGDDDTFAPT
jgi:hypothetical protein